MTDEGFRVTGSVPALVRWADVGEIATWKEDLFAYDLICVGFRLAGGTADVVIDERQGGYEAVVAAMARQFPSIPERWEHAVAFPAFVANYTVLFKKGPPEAGRSIEMPCLP